VVAVDGKLYGTSVTGTVRDLTERRSVKVTLCQQGKTDGALGLTSGPHRVEAGDTGPLTLTDVTLTRGAVAETTPQTRELTVQDWLGDRREVAVGAGAASYFTTYENFNDGWKATLNGKELTPLRLDGWQQGWRVPAGAGGTIKLSYEPATTYEAGLIGSGVAVAALLALVIWRRDEPNPDEFQPPPPLPGLWLGTVALTLVGAVIAGWFALLVPALALLAYRRHALLVPIAFVALAGAGIVSATGAGDPVGAGEGAFSRAAQLLALIGLFAALVSVRERSAPEPAPIPPLPQRARGTSALGEESSRTISAQARGSAPIGARGTARPAPTDPQPRDEPE
jgi:arabinofuranan 3-O-arabinosyltransferase